MISASVETTHFISLAEATWDAACSQNAAVKRRATAVQLHINSSTIAKGISYVNVGLPRANSMHRWCGNHIFTAQKSRSLYYSQFGSAYTMVGGSKSKVVPYSITSVGHGTDPSFLAVAAITCH